MALERLIARVALGAIAVHVVDDSYLQPQRGTSASDHLVGGGVWSTGEVARTTQAGIALAAFAFSSYLVYVQPRLDRRSL